MSMLEAFKGHKAVENPEYGAKKKLIGDAVAQVQSLEKIVSKKNQKEWIILKCEAIHPIADPKGRETTIVAGDELTMVYDPTSTEAVSDFKNDLFTAGIETEVKADSEDDLIVALGEAAKGKLIYFRTWTKDKTAEQIEKSKPGSPSFYQNIIIKSKNLITPENSVPELPF